LKDKLLLSRIGSDHAFLNALFDILIKYSYNWIHNIEIQEQTENFTETKSILINTSDIIAEFLERDYIITNDADDRIGKEVFYDNFKFRYPKSLMTCIQLINSVKDKGNKDFTYNSDMRANRIRGVFIGIKERPVLHGDVDKIVYDDGKKNPKIIESKTESPIKSSKTKSKKWVDASDLFEDEVEEKVEDNNDLIDKIMNSI
jgi:hypothetical protein